MGAEVVYHKRTQLTPAEEAQEASVRLYATKEEIFQTCDIISLHTPTIRIHITLSIKKSLSMMKPSAILVNTARGKVVNEADLVEALKNKTIAGAALDVFEHGR